MTTISKDDLAGLKARAKKLAMEKSYFQMIIRMMNTMSIAPGLENTIHNILHNIAEVIGGTNLILYYMIDNERFHADVFGKRAKIAKIDDLLVQKVIETRQPIEEEQNFRATKTITPEFTKAYTWIYPLVVGSELIGVLKMENLHFGMGELYRQLPSFFNYTALVLKNEIQGHTRLKQAHDKLQREIIERKKIEAALIEAKEQAEAANQAKSRFLASMSHELRTPLNAILGYSQLMQRGVSMLPEHREQLAVINRSGEHLLALINEVLEISKIEAGKSTLDVATFNFRALLGDLEEMFRVRMDAKGLQFGVIGIDDVPRYLKTDENKLRRVLINVLGNAVKFTERGGVTLRVSVENKKDRRGVAKNERRRRVRFKIEDTGVGISEEELDNVFAYFAQTESGRKSKIGTGLGLAITRDYIRMLGGDITVTSALGKGSTFRFDISAGQGSEADIKERAKLRQRVICLAPDQDVPRILVAEDVKESRTMLVKLLRTAGFQVREAGDGERAVEIFQKWQPDFIWMDIRMPVMDGYKATAKIRQLPGGDAVKIVAITASAFKEERRKIVESGCDKVVLKPFQIHEIFETMAEQLGVHYIYEEGREAQQVTPAIALTEEMIAGLPADLRQKLRQAAHNLEVAATERVIAEIRSNSPEIAERLQLLTDHVQFGQILKLLGNKEKTRAVNREGEEDG
jgi:signal transduction histidine kinase/CheY-like chemotaxis protein